MSKPAFNAEGWRIIIVVVQVGAVSALRKKESHDETVGKASLGPSYFALFCFVKFSFPVLGLMPYYAERNWPLSPPTRETLWITLLKQLFCEKYQAKGIENYHNYHRL
jgi:hypothetical protein